MTSIKTAALIRAIAVVCVLTAPLAAVSPAIAAVTLHITTQPVGDSIFTGANAVFSASASSFAPVRWQSSADLSAGFTYIPGANSHRLVIRDVARSQSGTRYRAVFETPGANLVTRAATLQVRSNIGQAWDPNWSGYALTGAGFTAVSGSWTVPTPQCTPGANPSAATWLGIDGYGSSLVEQIGVDEGCSNGTPSYGAWYQMYGNTTPGDGGAGLDPTAYPVFAGDVMTASVSFASGLWTLQLKNVTQAWNYEKVLPNTIPTAPRVSAEWIVERPTLSCGPTCTYTQLPTLSPVAFTDASATTTIAGVVRSGAINQFAYSTIYMIVRTHFISKPGPLSDGGTSFTVVP